MSQIEDVPLELLTEKLFNLNLELDKRLAESKKITDKIKAKYEPRAEFNRWRNSQGGKYWKHKQHKAQNECCAICEQKIPLKGSHIDHIKPLSSYPDLALDLGNLQITCPDCNTSKSSSDSREGLP